MASVLAGALGWLAMIGLRGTIALGWRTMAACSGVLAAGWLVSTIPGMIDNRAEASAPVEATGSLVREATASRTPEWVQIQRPTTTFSIAIDEPQGQQLRTVVRRDLASQAREDQFQVGLFSSETRFLLLALNRMEDRQTVSFFVDMSRKAGEAGLSITRSAQPLPLNSKFGILEAADVMVSDGTVTRGCLAFRHMSDSASFSFRGWLCGTETRPADRQQLTCLIDRVTLLAAGEDRQLRTLFSKAELQRQPQCLQPKLHAAGRKANWLDVDQPAPAMRRRNG